MLAFLNRLHRFSMRQALYPLILSTLLACLLLVARIYVTGHWTYIFLVWNLFLAWIPYLASFWTSYLYQRPAWRWLSLPILGPAWLAFFPNAPYIITDFLHLQPRPPAPIWYDIILIAAFAWAGLFLAIFSLRAMQILVKAAAGPLVGWLFVVGVIGLTGLGIYLGRFLGWNSWDLLLNPSAILNDITIRLGNPMTNLQAFVATFLFAGFLLTCYLTITANQLTMSNEQ